METLFLILYVRRTHTAQTDGQMTADGQGAQEAEGQTGGWDSDRVGPSDGRTGGRVGNHLSASWPPSLILAWPALAASFTT
jgi:hypothetical protein